MVGLLLDVFPLLPVSYLILKAHKHVGKKGPFTLPEPTKVGPRYKAGQMFGSIKDKHLQPAW